MYGAWLGLCKTLKCMLVQACFKFCQYPTIGLISARQAGRRSDGRGVVVAVKVPYRDRLHESTSLMRQSLQTVAVVLYNAVATSLLPFRVYYRDRCVQIGPL